MKKTKWLSYTIDAVLVGLIAFFGYVQISMLVTKDGNHGVPMAFGSSFLYVSTDSMDDPDGANEVHQGSGIIIQSADIASLRISTPITDEDGNIIDYKKDGDVVTFYYDKIKAPDTHRLIGKEYDEATGKYTLTTMGDNPIAHQRKTKETWSSDNLIGRKVHASDGLGTLLTLISPDAAASAGKTAWLLPVAVIVPLILLAVLSIFDVFKVARQKEAEEEEQMKEAMIAAGIDLNDDVAVETFRQKEEFKTEYRAKLLEETERAKKEARKRMKRQAKKGGNNA